MNIFAGELPGGNVRESYGGPYLQPNGKMMNFQSSCERNIPPVLRQPYNIALTQPKTEPIEDDGDLGPDRRTPLQPLGSE